MVYQYMLELIESSVFLLLMYFPRKTDRATPLAVPRGVRNKALPESNHTWSFASHSRNFHLQADLQTGVCLVR